MSGEAEGEAALSAAKRALVRVSAAIPARSPDLLRGTLEEAREVARPEDVEEILLQSHLFVGYPVGLEAMAAWREVRGVDAEDAGEAPPEEWRVRGARVCRTVYGDQYGALRSNVRRIHPAMEPWMVEHGYGRVLGRPGPDLSTRELCVAALLAVLDAPSQLYSHLRGALNAGASTGAVEAALEAAQPFAGPDARQRAREVWEGVRARRSRARVPGRDEER